jgi:hypothetical protein
MATGTILRHAAYGALQHRQPGGRACHMQLIFAQAAGECGNRGQGSRHIQVQQLAGLRCGGALREDGRRGRWRPVYGAIGENAAGA